jgi:hypothetical protein
MFNDTPFPFNARLYNQTLSFARAIELVDELPLTYVIGYRDLNMDLPSQNTCICEIGHA